MLLSWKKEKLLFTETVVQVRLSDFDNWLSHTRPDDNNP